MIRWWRWGTLPARLGFMLHLSDRLNPALKQRSANHCLRNSDGTRILPKSCIKIAESSFHSKEVTEYIQMLWAGSLFLMLKTQKTHFLLPIYSLYLTKTANNPQVKKYSQINLKTDFRDRLQTVQRHLKGARIQMCTWCFSFSVVFY